MPFDTRKILLEQFLARRTRQRAASVARANESLQGHVEMPVQVVVPVALRKYNDAAVRSLIASGKRRGYVTFKEANAILPDSELSIDEVETFMTAIIELGFEM